MKDNTPNITEEKILSVSSQIGLEVLRWPEELRKQVHKLGNDLVQAGVECQTEMIPADPQFAQRILEEKRKQRPQHSPEVAP